MLNQLNQTFPVIDVKRNYFLIKTYNGKYYSKYLEDNEVGLYSLNFFDAKENLLSQILMTEGNKKAKALGIFINHLTVNDIVLIPNIRNQKITIGQITSHHYLKKQKIFKKVTWLKEIETSKITHIHKFLHVDQPIICINDIKAEVERNCYSFFQKEYSYHVVLKVNQPNHILCKSIYGLYHLFLKEETQNELKIKMSLQSPGLIELITENIDVILTIIKVIKIIELLANKQVKTDSEDTFIKNNQYIIDKYYEYEVDKLQLDIPNINYDLHNF